MGAERRYLASVPCENHREKVEAPFVRVDQKERTLGPLVVVSCRHGRLGHRCFT